MMSTRQTFPDAIDKLDDLFRAIGNLTYGDMRNSERVHAVWLAYRELDDSPQNPALS